MRERTGGRNQGEKVRESEWEAGKERMGSRRNREKIHNTK